MVGDDNYGMKVNYIYEIDEGESTVIVSDQKKDIRIGFGDDFVFYTNL